MKNKKYERMIEMRQIAIFRKEKKKEHKTAKELRNPLSRIGNKLIAIGSYQDTSPSELSEKVINDKKGQNL